MATLMKFGRLLTTKGWPLTRYDNNFDFVKNNMKDKVSVIIL